MNFSCFLLYASITAFLITSVALVYTNIFGILSRVGFLSVEYDVKAVIV